MPAPDVHDRIAQLEAEVAGLRRELDDTDERVGRRTRWRRRLVGTLVVLTSLAILASVVGVWVHRQIYDTDAWIASIEDLPAQPEVAEALATELSAQIVEVADVRARVSATLPVDAQGLAGPITVGVGQLLDQILLRIIESDEFRTVWIGINRVAHDRLVAVLDGGRGNLDVTDGTVEPDLLPLVTAALSALAEQAPGLLGDGEVPDIDPGAARDRATRALADHLGTDVPEDFGRITIFESSRLGTVQDAATTFTRFVWLLLAATAGLLIASLVLSTDRRRTLVQLGIGAVAAVVVARVGGQLARNEILEAIADDAGRDAARAAMGQLTAGLRSTTALVLSTGLLVALAAYLLGESPPARWVRAQAAGVSSAATGAVDVEASPLAEWVRGHRRGLRAGGLVVALAVALLVPLTWSRLLALGAAFVAYLALVAALAGAAPPSTAERAPDRPRPSDEP